jgi:hypothetical protein
MGQRRLIGRKCALVLFLASVFLAGCDTPSSRNLILGKWFNSGNNSVIEFKDNGVFSFSNAGILTLGAEWLIVEKGRIRVQVVGLGAPPPEVCDYDVRGDTLRFSGCTFPPVWKRVPR